MMFQFFRGGAFRGVECRDFGYIEVSIGVEGFGVLGIGDVGSSGLG